MMLPFRTLAAPGLLGLLLAISLAGCRADPPAPTIGPGTAPLASGSPVEPSPPAAAPVPTAAAVIRQIAAQPVWVQPQAAAAEQDAATGMALAYGDRLRTAAKGLAEVDLHTGLAFRIGGDAVLTLHPDNRLQMDSGQMITWVVPGQSVPTEIVTPVGIAGLRGTTLFINIPDPTTGEVEFFSWEGDISIRLPGSSETVTLRSGDQIFIRPGERDIPQLRRRVRRLNRREARQRRRRSPLINGFQRPLPTLPEIDAVLDDPDRPDS